MQKILITAIIACIFITHMANAQTKTPAKQKVPDSIRSAVFSIDLSPPNSRTVKAQISRGSLQFGTNELPIFQLKNGNPFKYKYVINTNMVSFFNEGYNPIDSAGNMRKNQQLASALAAKSAAVSTDTAATKKYQAKVDSLVNVNKKLKGDYDNLKALRNASNDQKTKMRKLFDSLRKNRDTSAFIARQIKHITDTTAKNNFARESNALNATISNNQSYAAEKKELNIKTDPVADTKKKALDNLKKNALIVNQKASKLDDEINEFNSELQSEDCIDVNKFKAKRDSLKTQYFKVINDANTLDAAAQNIAGNDDNDYKSIRSGIDVSLKDMHNVLHLFYAVHLQNYIMPIDVNGKNIDLLKVTVERHESKTAALIDKYEYQLWVKGGFKFDISGGAFITSLVNNKYITADTLVGTANRKVIYKSDAGRFEIGFGSMLNMSYRTGSAWLRPSLSIGALFSNEQKFQFLTGFGLMMGKEQRVIIHYGLSMGNVTRIELPYTVSTLDKKTPYDLGTSTQVPTTEKFEFGHYFGITYNFGSAKAKAPGVKEY